MARSKSSSRWMAEHFEDEYVKMAQAQGYRSRAVFKLKEIQEKDQLIKPGMNIVDLGAAPGGWSQYARQLMGKKNKLVALDILPMDALEGVEFIQGDFREDSVFEQLQVALAGAPVTLVMSDMAPNMSGNVAVDIPRSMYLTELAFDFADKMLKPGGAMLMKVFHGTGFDELVKEVRLRFERVVIRKPLASRSRSRETYLLAKGYNL